MVILGLPNRKLALLGPGLEITGIKFAKLQTVKNKSIDLRIVDLESPKLKINRIRPPKS